MVMPAMGTAKPLGPTLGGDRVQAGLLGGEPLLPIVKKSLWRLASGGPLVAAEIASQYPAIAGSETGSVEQALFEDP